MNAPAALVVAVAVMVAGALFFTAAGVTEPQDAPGEPAPEPPASTLSREDLRNVAMGLFALLAVVVLMRYVEEEG